MPGVRFAVDAYVAFARTRPWLEAVASSLTELFAPGLMAERLAAFEKHYTWIDPDGLAYFRNRLHAGPADSEHALELVIAHCRTPEQQAAPWPRFRSSATCSGACWTPSITASSARRLRLSSGPAAGRPRLRRSSG